MGRMKEERENERQAPCKEKALHGQSLRETEWMQDQRGGGRGAVTDSRWAETRKWKPCMCCARTST